MSPTEIVTLLFTDLVRSTELVQWLGDDAADDFRKLHFDLVRSAVGAHGGREVKNLGDGFMVVFESAVEGLGAAVAIQRAVDGHNRGGTGPDFQVRVGIHAGETAREDGDYFGTPVILAKRLCDTAAGGQILASEILTGLVGSRGHYAFRSLGPQRLKGLAEAVAVAEVLWDSDEPPEVARTGVGRVVRPTTLTPPPDSFIGRDTELAMLADRLERSRLVTVIGPGGVGKTRLCGHVVDAVAERYPDGVWCCALASVAADDQVPEAVTTALRVERRAGMTTEERLVEFLITKELLLVLDNCEHVIEGAASFASAVLAGTGGVDVLATSREPLGVPGEQRVPLEPLAVPDEGTATDVTPAVALFLERANAANPRLDLDLDLDDDGLAVIRALCRRLDGLPLALELAAARVATQTVHELYADLTDRLGALSVRRGRPERHRSIAAMVEWSYELLDERDRRLFERLAVFAGGWNADAVAPVAGDDGDGVLSRLERLVEQSLVSSRSQAQRTRYNLLEPVRAYAEGRLRASGDEDEGRDAHAAFFGQLAEQADAGLRTREEVQWADRLDQEMANLRAAHRWLMQRGNADGSLRLVGALLAFGLGVGVAELHAWAAEAAERFASTGHPALSAAWGTAAWGAWHGGDLVRAEAFATRSLAAAGDGSPGMQLAIQIAGVVQLTFGRFDRAAELFRRSAERSRTAGDDLCLVYALGSYGLALAYGGQSEPARHMADAGLEVAAAGGNTTMRAWANYYAGEVRLETHPDEASALFRRSLAEGASSRLLVGAAGLSALSLEARHGDQRAALVRFPELIEHWQRSGAWNEMWVTLRILIETLDRLGESAPAAVLYGAICASATAPPIVGQDASRLSVALEHLREDLGPDALRHHQQHGAALGDHGAVTFALEAIRSILSGSVTPPA